MRCSSWTFCTFLLLGRVVVVLACGVQDTELELDTLEGVLDTPEELAEVPAASSSEPGQLGPRSDLCPYI